MKKEKIESIEYSTVHQQVRHLHNNLPNSWKRFVNMRLIEHNDNDVPECFKHYDVQYWMNVYSILERL